jgi:uncharacterized protein with HEPN domain
MNKRERDITIYFQDILKAIESIEEFVKGMDFEAFKRDDKTVSAVIRKFEIMGEAARNIPKNIRNNYPDIPWKEMIGFRDKLIHFYFGIKYEIVWDTIKMKLPDLKEKIKKILEEMKK